jgi:hypothetical protein
MSTLPQSETADDHAAADLSVSALFEKRQIEISRSDRLTRPAPRQDSEGNDGVGTLFGIQIFQTPVRGQTDVSSACLPSASLNVVELGIAQATRDLFLSSFQDILDDPSRLRSSQSWGRCRTRCYRRSICLE